MATAERETPQSTRSGASKKRQGWLLPVSCILAWLGAAVSILLMNSSPGKDAPFCPTHSGCETVLASRYASVHGLPLPWVGLTFYVVTLVLLLTSYGSSSGRVRSGSLNAALWLCVVALGTTAVLMYIQFGILRTFCPLCTASAVIVLSLTVILSRYDQAEDPAAAPASLGASLGLTAISVLSLGLLFFTSRRPSDEILATVDGKAITRREMEQALGKTHQQLRTKVARIEFEWLQRRVERVVLEAEAKRRGLPAEQLLVSESVVAPIDDSEVQSRLKSKGITKSPESAAQMRATIAGERQEQARSAILSKAVDQHRIEFKLEPPEVAYLDIDLSTAKTSGPRNAPIQLVVFSDFECEFCAALAPVLSRIRVEYPDDVLVAYRYFPLERHLNAFAAALAAEAAAEQGAFWEFHDRLYKSRAALNEATFLSIATDLGLNVERFRQVAASERARATVEASRADADAAGLEGAPMLFLNGRKIGGKIEYERLSALIRAELQRAPTLRPFNGANEKTYERQ